MNIQEETLVREIIFVFHVNVNTISVYFNLSVLANYFAG